jgi:hypothetical protein
MEYIAIFGIAMIVMLIFSAVTIPKDKLHAGNTGAIRVLVFGVPAALTFLVWAFKVIFLQ